MEGTNDVILINASDGPRKVIFNIEREGWPDIQMLLDRSSVCAENS
jgi:hypothetical protein